jgi:methyl-accepting chemotaxis protein
MAMSLDKRIFATVLCISLSMPAVSSWAADDPPSNPAADHTLAHDQAKAASDSIKRGAKAVADGAKEVAGAAKDKAKEVARSAKAVAHEVATASKEGAQQVAATAKKGAERAKAAANGEKTSTPPK